MDRKIKFNWAPSLEAAKRGDREAQEFIYKKIYPMVMKVALSHTFSNQDAEDLTQVIMINVFRHLDQVKHPEAFLSWARTVAERCAISEARKQAQRKKIADIESLPEVSDEDEQGMNRIGDPNAPNPEEELDHSMVREILNQIFQTLPEIQATCLTMWRDGYTGTEIAETLQIPIGTVKSHLYQAKRRVKSEVLSLEKQGVHLYSLAPITFFVFLLALDEKFSQNDASSMASAFFRSFPDGLPVQHSTGNHADPSRQSGGRSSVSKMGGSHGEMSTLSGAGATAAAAGSTHAAKIIAIIAAVCIGGGAAVPIIRNAQNTEREETATLTESSGSADNSSENTDELYMEKYRDTLDLINDYIIGEKEVGDDLDYQFYWLHEFYGIEAEDHVGYALTDLSGDGIPELVIGRVDNPDIEEGFTQIFDIYTIKQDKAIFVLSGWDRNTYYYLGEGRFLSTGLHSFHNGFYGTFHLSEDGSQLNCEDYYFTEPVACESDQILYYHNTTGADNPAASEQLSVTDDVFWQKESELEGKVQLLNLTPFSEYTTDTGQ